MIGGHKMNESKLMVETKKLGKIYNFLKEKNIEEVSFECVVGSCFPNVYENIQKEIRQQYTQGYADGLAGRKEMDL